jgi:hypothetical protein
MSVLEALSRHPLPYLDFNNRDIFIGNLLLVHSFMIASEDLIEEALKQDMPNSLRDYYIEHLEEERNHAEWLKEDLTFLGVKPTIDWTAAQIVGTQYYLIKYVDPKALLGYMAALECRPMPLEHVEYIESLYGKEAMRCMRYHAVHDQGHGKELLAFIDTFDDQGVIIRNAELTASVIENTLQHLQETLG